MSRQKSLPVRNQVGGWVHPISKHQHFVGHFVRMPDGQEIDADEEYDFGEDSLSLNVCKCIPDGYSPSGRPWTWLSKPTLEIALI